MGEGWQDFLSAFSIYYVFVNTWVWIWPRSQAPFLLAQPRPQKLVAQGLWQLEQELLFVQMWLS